MIISAKCDKIAAKCDSLQLPDSDVAERPPQPGDAIPPAGRILRAREAPGRVQEFSGWQTTDHPIDALARLVGRHDPPTRSQHVGAWRPNARGVSRVAAPVRRPNMTSMPPSYSDDPPKFLAKFWLLETSRPRSPPCRRPTWIDERLCVVPPSRARQFAPICVLYPPITWDGGMEVKKTESRRRAS